VSSATAWVDAVLGRLRRLPSVQITLALALLVLGFLIAAQLASEGQRVRYTTEERAPLIETALNLQAQEDALKAQILDLRQRIGNLEAQGPDSAASLRQLYQSLQDARLAAGLIPISGPGVAFRLEDAASANAGADSLVSARDVRVVIEELWLAGAEAVAVNNERVTVSTAVLDIGGSILVNSAYLAGPYTVSAIGPPDLADRVQASRSFQDFVRDRVNASGIGLSVAVLGSVDLPAFAGTINLRFGQPVVSPEPSP
jgi:uncharacterized protein YlxW (UPF0749 family)